MQNTALRVRSLTVRNLVLAALRLCSLRPAAAFTVVGFQGLAWMVWHTHLRGVRAHWITWVLATLLILYTLSAAGVAAAWAHQGHSVELGPLLRWSWRRFVAVLRCVVLQAVSLAGVTALAVALVWVGACAAGYAAFDEVPVVRRAMVRQALGHLPLHPGRAHIPTRSDAPWAALATLAVLWLITCLWLLVRWSLALDITLVEKVAPSRALGMSWRRTYGRSRQVLVLHGFFIVLLVGLRLGCRALGVELFAVPLPFMGALFVGPLWVLSHGIYYAEVSHPALKLSRKEAASAETFPGRY